MSAAKKNKWNLFLFDEAKETPASWLAQASSPAIQLQSINQNNFDFLNWFVEFAAAGLVGQPTNQPINQHFNQTFLIECWDWLLIVVAGPHSLIKLTFLPFVFFQRQENKLRRKDWVCWLRSSCAPSSFANSIHSAYGPGPNARQFFLYFFSSPIRKSELERNKENWMSWAIRQLK